MTLLGFIHPLLFFFTFQDFLSILFSQAELQKQTGADERCLVGEAGPCFRGVTPH